MDDTSNLIELTADVTAAWLGNPNTRVAADTASAFLKAVHDAIVQLGGSAESQPTQYGADPVSHIPAVTVRKSLASPDHIVSLIDGKPYRTLHRHLSTNGLTPDEYGARYNLKSDYPMIAPTYSEARRATAKKIGLGRKPKAPAASAPTETAKPERRKLGVAVAKA